MTETLFSNAFQHAAIGMALVGRDGRWLEVNRSLCELVGYSEAELLTRSFQEITHPEDLETDLNYVAAMLLGTIDEYQMEKRYFRKNGDIVWVLLSVSLCRTAEGEPDFFISQIQDITRRKSAEAALKKSLAEKEALLRELEQSTAALRKLKKDFVTVCAWTQRVHHDGKWMNLTKFLSEHLELSLSHTISEEAVEQFLPSI